MARRRPLRPEEKKLWQAVARTARPMHGVMPPAASEEIMPLPSAEIPRPDPVAAPLPRFRLGEKSQPSRGHNLAPALSQQLSNQPLQMDARAFGRMTRGKLSPEARIDLHGMTLSEAHPELIRFVLNAHSAGMRLILVITGKGAKTENDYIAAMTERGILRTMLPIWLSEPGLSHMISGWSLAARGHGGEGAWYVRLRRP